MKLHVLIGRLCRLRVRGNISPLRRLLSIGFPQKLAEKLILTGQNQEACHQRRRLACVRIYHYMVCRLPQRIFNMGQLLRQNYHTLYKISADMGCCDAAIYLGLYLMRNYESSSGFIPVYEITVSYFEIAALQGRSDAQHYLGKMLLDRNLSKAKKWLTDAALNGNCVRSQFLLGHICGPTEEANRWYNLAAYQGHTEAQYISGCLDEWSNNLEDAVSWFRLAASSEHFNSKDNLFNILKNHPKLRQEAEVQFFNENSDCDSRTLKRRWFDRK